MGNAILEEVVFLGHAFAVEASSARSSDAEEPLDERVDLLRPSGYQCHERRAELEDQTVKKTPMVSATAST